MAENKSEFPCFVCDCSFIISFLLNGLCGDEFKGAAKEFERVIFNNGQIYVPQIFWYEVNNVLLYKSRTDSKGVAKITDSQVSEILYDLQQLPIYTDLQMSFDIQLKTRDLALEYDLSFYDASYLELARRFNLQLKTFDKKLQGCLELN